MKNCFRNVLIALLGSVVIFASCKDEDDVPKSVACDIVSFSVDTTAWTISGTNITHTYPPETEEKDLTPTITISDGATISPLASVAKNFFAESGVTYVVTAEDGVTTKTYTAKATRTPYSAACDIVSFTVEGDDEPWTINDTLITRVYPTETVEGMLTPTIALLPGATVSPASGVQQDFFVPEGVTYTVTAEDKVTTKTYTVKATRTLATTCDIVTFVVGNDEWTINDTLITRVYPTDTDETLQLTPTITLVPGATVNPASGAPQNFFAPEGVRYTVTAEDGETKKTYTAKATRTLATTCDIVKFVVGDDEWSIVDDTLITREYPTDTDVTLPLTPKIDLVTGATVNPASDEPQNFFTAEGVRYTVTAEDGTTTKTYTAKATRTLSSACDLISFNVGSIVWKIEGDRIVNTYPEGTEASPLTPVITVSPGATVFPDPNIPQDFFGVDGFTYTVTAEDGIAQKTYTAIATITQRELSSACDITWFDVGGLPWFIDGTNITYTYMSGDFEAGNTGLYPAVEVSEGATVTPGYEPLNFFTQDGVTFVVTAEDGVTTKTYTAKAFVQQTGTSVPANREGWTVSTRYAHHQWDDAGGGMPELVLDGDVTTGWHTPANGDTPPPYSMLVDMQDSKSVTAVELLDHPEHNEWIYFNQIHIYISDEPYDPNQDNFEWAYGDPLYSYTWNGETVPITINLPTPAWGRYLMLVFPDTRGEQYVNFTELNVYVEQ